MKVINISDSRNRNTQVSLQSRRQPTRNRFVDANNQAVASARVVKSNLDTDLKALVEAHSLEELAQALVDGDPEIDIELFGKRINQTTRIYLDSENRPANGVVIKEEVHAPSGEVKELRDFVTVESNINTEKPLKWSGKLMPKKQFFRKFSFVGAYQVAHVDGLTYDFLYGMAKELQEKDSFLYLGAGDKANQPLVLARNGTPYRAFLEGRISGDKYMLIVHLTNMELKPMTAPEE